MSKLSNVKKAIKILTEFMVVLTDKVNENGAIWNKFLIEVYKPLVERIDKLEKDNREKV